MASWRPHKYSWTPQALDGIFFTLQTNGNDIVACCDISNMDLGQTIVDSAGLCVVCVCECVTKSENRHESWSEYEIDVDRKWWLT